MKKFIMIILVFALCGQAFANFTNGDFSDGLNGWSRIGAVSAPSGYATLGAPMAQIWQDLTFDVSGKYSLSFDYRAGQNVDVTFGTGSSTVYFIGLDAASDWTHITTPPPPINLEAGQSYMCSFYHSGNGALDVDNVSLSLITSPHIPAPGAILLGSIGVGLVGWLRRRRVL